MKFKNSQIPMTPAERATIERMDSEGYVLREIAAHMRRSTSVIWRVLHPDQDYSHRRTKQHPVREFTPPDPAAVADRDYRLALAPRDLTAVYCGDPLPGYSALDRRSY